jgi:hypothetical protein
MIMGREVRPRLNLPQYEFLMLPTKFSAYIGGYGAGKTWALCAKACNHYLKYPKMHRGYFGATYSQIRDIYYPTIEEVASEWGMKAKIREGNKEVDFYSGREYRGTTICRSMDKPNTIVGFKIARADVDEIDTLPMKKAQTAWRKIIARLRLRFDGLNGADVGTTPEGFRFAYQQWVVAVEADPAMGEFYGRVHASTYDNEENLPADYIPSLLASYPSSLIEAYIEGQFTNLTSGGVYPYYHRVKNRSNQKVEKGDALHIGMDFNVGRMSAVVHVERKDKKTDETHAHAVHEFANVLDTPSMIDLIRKQYGEWSGDRWRMHHRLTIYPDSTGGRRSSANASVSDLQLLKSAGFDISVDSVNPPVRDRIVSVNTLLCNSQQVRRYFVNDSLTPVYASCLEQQAYNDNGEPDKVNNLDHLPDASGYYIHRRFPVRRRHVRLGQYVQ